MKKSRWTQSDLICAVAGARSVRQVLGKLGLREAGGNYTHVKRAIQTLDLDTSHFVGEAWNKGLSVTCRQGKPLASILVINSSYQSYKLKKRLFREGIKQMACELCGWCKKTIDGRIPLELDHINGDNTDNRLENLRILCPNCHSLQSTHRGLNRRKK